MSFRQIEILKQGSFEEVKNLMKTEFSLNPLCPLHYAVANPDFKILIYLIDNFKWTVNETTESGETPLLRAAFYGNLEAISLLISRGANIHAKNSFGFDFFETLEDLGWYDKAKIAKKIILAEKEYNVSACYELAILYLRGSFIKPNFDLAKNYINKGLRSKDISEQDAEKLKNIDKEINQLKEREAPKGFLTQINMQLTALGIFSKDETPPLLGDKELYIKKNQ